MKSPSIVKNYIYDSLYHIMTFFIPLITTPYLSRVLQPEGVGTFSYVLSIQTYFSMFAALGTVTYGARVIAQSRDDKKLLSENFWGIELLTIITSIVSIFFWLILSLVVENTTYFLILTINILATTFDISWFFSGLELFKTLSIRNCFFKIIGAIFIFTFVKSPDDLVIYFLIYSSTALCSSISLWIKLKKYINKVKLADLKIGKHFRETLIYFLPTIATSIYTVLDKTLIGLIVRQPKENGFYEQANQIVNIAKTLTFGSINTVIGTRLSYLFSKGSLDEMKQKLHTAIDFVFLIGYGIVFGVIVVAKDFVFLYFGEGYDKVTCLLYFLMPIVIIISVSACLGNQYYVPVGKRLTSAKYIIYGSVINFILNLCFIPLLKSLGACIATLMAELLISILYVRGCDNYLNWHDIWNKSIKKAIAGVIMFLGVSCLNLMLVRCKAGTRFLVDVVTGMGIYFIMLILFKDNSLSILIDWIDKRRSKSGK